MHSPLKLMLVGSVVFVGAVALSASRWLSPPPTLDASGLETVSGRITGVAVRARNPQLRIWLDDREDPFCSTGPYPTEYPQDALDRVAVGSVATLSFPKSELEAPRRNLAEGFSFREITSLEVDGSPLLTLAASNRWSVANHRQGRIIGPSLAALGAACFIAGWRARAKPGDGKEAERAERPS